MPIKNKPKSFGRNKVFKRKKNKKKKKIHEVKISKITKSRKKSEL